LIVTRATVIVRARDAAATIERALEGLRAQTVSVEIVVVDSGSSDATVEIARRYCDQLIEIGAGEFSFGRALNIGARAAGAPVHFALSAHCAPGDTAWVERSLAHYERPEVAGTSGYRAPGPLGQTGVFFQGSAELRAHPYWGYSNTAGSWRAEVWERFPFDESLDAAEDREWSWRVLESGYVIAMDPALEVASDHRRSAGLRQLYNRYRKEAEAIAGFAADRPYPIGAAVRDWWRVQRTDGRSAARVRSSPWHIAATLGRYTGERSAWRSQGM
jgi:rhamnosyltransferase